MNDKISKKRKAKITLLNAFVYLSTGIIILMLIGIIGYVFYRGLPNLSFDFLTSTPSLIKDTAGILPNILNTVYIILMTLVIVLPIGVGAAIYLNEYAKNKRFVRVIELATETLSGIPSIIYGLVGMLMDDALPQLILLDIMLPEEDGLSVLKKLQSNKKYENIPVIMITAKNSEFDKATGLDLGADDYIAKPFGMVEFVSRVRAVLRRYEKTKNKNSIFEIGKLYVDFEKHIIKVSGEAIELSYKEYKLLSVLLEADGKVVTRDELLQKVWGEFYEESRTLDVHIRKLRVKLKVAGNYIKTVKNIGYQFMGDTNE